MTNDGVSAAARGLAAVIVLLALTQIWWHGARDSDGIADSVDQCPQTPLQHTVDAGGCAAVEHAFQRGIKALSGADARFSDLYAERAAFLLAFGSPPRDETARWVDDARSLIKYDGRTSPAVHEWTHTSGMAVAALGLYLHGPRAEPGR